MVRCLITHAPALWACPAPHFQHLQVTVGLALLVSVHVSPHLSVALSVNGTPLAEALLESCSIKAVSTVSLLQSVVLVMAAMFPYVCMWAACI